ncbi:MAG: hypothetical protein EPO55_22105 [Reyranella sp.]|uniref:hypothetical protein n=1 Tax=Reyranella sp. TaxID=1929291 RepID=UPI00120CBEB9|nr:hypothetical protein [Reyranella sp.]TAJ36391.1 MAG: hypothetical protein EPO55_22105 [Reyranella sp.]
MHRRIVRRLLAALLALPAAAAAQDNAQNEGNDPLTPKAALQLQDYFQPFLNGQTGSGANQTNVRGVLPHDAFGVAQFARASFPALASAWGPGGSQTGIGDLTIFDVPVFFVDNVKFGVGPLAVVPTATSTALGDRRWQLGGQGIASARHTWGLTAVLAAYQQSFDRQSQSLTFQPLLFYNLDDGYYLRSSGIVSFDLAHRTTVVPIGIGLGRVIPLPSGRILNFFVEPQYSAIRSGDGVPTFQVYAGFNVQFPLGGGH